MENKSCKICTSRLEVEHRCKFCNEPTRLFCHTCGIMAEKIAHTRNLLHPYRMSDRLSHPPRTLPKRELTSIKNQ